MSHRSRNKKKRLGNKKKEQKPNVFQQDSRPDLTSGTKWTITTEQEKQNPLFDKFYRELVPAAEFDHFMTTLRSDLPIVFRTIPSSVFASFVNAEIEAQFPGGAPVQVGEVLVDPPRQLNWYPSVWQFKASRKETRQEPKLAEFKKWLVGSAEAGQVVRQEAVSMIPPVLLDAHDGHVVLDTCAAPGSKTTQLLEAIHDRGVISTGLVIANELDESRARMLTHRLKAITSPNLIITNHDGRMFPRLHVGIDQETAGGGAPLDFDRILCDVPCTGDGTLRKAADLWVRWSPEMAKGIHGMQLAIAQRSVRMLKEGGRMVYSTCSMNPMEDEAVVSEILRWSQGAMRLVDASAMLPLFRRTPGVTTWRIMNKNGDFVEPADEEAKNYQRSMWPPSREEVKQFNLDRCWRIYPHHQDTGGFFCAVLEKISVLPGAPKRAKIVVEGKGKEDVIEDGEGEEEEVAAAAEVEQQDKAFLVPDEKQEEGQQQPAKEHKKRVRRNYESPYFMVDPNSEAGETVRQGIEYFGLDLDPARFMVRNEKSVGVFFYVGGMGPDVLPMDTVGRLHVMSAGMRVFVKHKRTGGPFGFRLASEACGLLAERMSKRVVKIKLADAAKLIAADSVLFADLEPETRAALAKIDPGSIIYQVECTSEVKIPVIGWLAAKSAQFQVPKENKEFLQGIITRGIAAQQAMQQ